MMLKKPVTPFTRYSTPAILAVCLVEFIPALLLFMTLARDGPSLQPALLCYVRGRYTFGHNVGHFNFPKISALRRFSPLRVTKPRVMGMSQKPTPVPPV